MKWLTARLSVLLALATIVNVAVAWGWVVWRPGQIGLISFTEWRWTNESLAVWRQYALPTWPEPEVVKRHELGYELGELPGAILTAYQHAFPGTDYPADKWTFAMDVVWEDSGWPMLSLRAIEWREGTVAQDFKLVKRAYLIVDRPSDHVGQVRGLPVRPIWPGFAINTVFYAVILWVLWWGGFAAPFALRRRRRIRRGLCPACAYPVGMGASPVCTECGKPLQRKETAA